MKRQFLLAIFQRLGLSFTQFVNHLKLSMSVIKSNTYLANSMTVVQKSTVLANSSCRAIFKPALSRDVISILKT